VPETQVPETQSQLFASTRRRVWLFFAAQLAAFAIGLALTIPTELERWRIARHDPAGVVAWFFEFHLDTTLPLLLLAVAPFCWFVRRRPVTSAADNEPRASEGSPGAHTDWAAWVMALACFATSLGASAWVASRDVGEGAHRSRFGDLPPAYHDEFSYLLQAKTFLAGRLSYPSSPQLPQLFDQMHVVNEGRFASRYFPGVGAWIAPFLGLGHPYWGQWLAGALAAFFTFWAGRELAGNRVGLLAGLLTALSPGLALFDNLLLSHPPTLAALTLFLFTFLRFMRTGRASAAFWAGCGLSFAMLCRPMTAAGFGLPFGIWMLVKLGRGLRQPTSDDGRRLLKSTLCLAAPLAAGLALLLFYNWAITGNGLLSPYQLYTDTYTPRHVYGFNNVVRGERRVGPRVMDNYDRWAENLTPGLALRNEETRLAASARWTLGLIPLAMAGVIFLMAALWWLEARWWLVAASVVSLHAVHIPYWFVGIMGWHYVFETAPLLLLIFAVTSRELAAVWSASGRLAFAVVTNWIPFDPFWSDSRVDNGVEEIAFARLRYEGFQRMLDQLVTQRPALVLIQGDPADRSIDYVVNGPELDAQVLRGRYRPGKTDLAKVRAAFPDRTLYLFDVKSGRMRQRSP
jgi:Dolichyl-phosphate-mannose-protein mannosyltransferase